MKIKATPEGRDDIWIPEKKSLKEYILSKGLKLIHKMPGLLRGIVIMGDVSVESVLDSIDNAELVSVFTDTNHNMGHSLALINGPKLECYDIGEITTDDIEELD